MTGAPLRALIVLIAMAALGGPAAARTLEVGPGRAYRVPSAAAAAAQDGDTVAIAPGDYFDCAFWHARNLTILGTGVVGGPEATITDTACGGKAAFVIQADGVTIRNLSFARIRVPDGNGAGIRAEGSDLTVIDSRFRNNQVAILSGARGGVLRIEGCSFDGNGGNPDGPSTQGVFAGAPALLHIERSSFEHARGGGHLSSSAALTELLDNRFADEGGRMTGPLVAVAGGSLTLRGNRVELAAGAADRLGVVLVTGAADAIVAQGNTLIEREGHVPLLRDWTGASVSEAGNVVPPGTLAVSDAGSTYHRLRATLAGLRDWVSELVRWARHTVAGLAHRVIPPNAG
jgi:hypothetical protein